MIEFISSADGVIAIKVTDRVTGPDLDAVMDRLDGAMARHDKIHVFAEAYGIDGIELAGLPSYVARAMPLFGKLARFGRVAMVADQAWLRIGTRIESAVPPFISYRVFEPDGRDEALAWVEGKPMI